MKTYMHREEIKNSADVVQWFPTGGPWARLKWSELPNNLYSMGGRDYKRIVVSNGGKFKKSGFRNMFSHRLPILTLVCLRCFASGFSRSTL